VFTNKPPDVPTVIQKSVVDLQQENWYACRAEALTHFHFHIFLCHGEMRANIYRAVSDAVPLDALVGLHRLMAPGK
jgi:hypothetical protein